MKSKILLLAVLCMACAIAQEEPTEEPNVTTVGNDADASSVDNMDAANVEASGNDGATEPDQEQSEPQTETNNETDSPDSNTQENSLPSESTDTQNNGDGGEVAKVTTSAPPAESGDSNENSSNGETDSNSPTEDNEDSVATTPSDAAPEQPPAVTVTAAPTTDAPTTDAPTTDAPTTDAPASPTPAPEFTCQSVGRFPHPDSCEKYYYCWDTVHQYAVFTCPKVFDPVSKLCVNNYAVCPLAPTCEADKQVLPFPDDKTAFFECRLESDKEALVPIYEIRKEECGKGREFDAELGYCKLITPNEWTSSESGSSERFECSGVGIFIDYSSETHYIECIIKSVSKGTMKAVRRKCPKYTVFSAADLQCIPL